MTRSGLSLLRNAAAGRAALVSALAFAAVSAPKAAAAVPQVEQNGDAARARELYLKGRAEMAKEGRLPQAYAYLHERRCGALARHVFSC